MIDCNKCVNHSGCEIKSGAIDCPQFSLRVGRRDPAEFCRGCVHRITGNPYCRKYGVELEVEMDLKGKMCLRIAKCVKENGWKLV